MGKKKKKPELFNVLPSEQLRKALAGSLPGDTQARWEKLGTMKVGGEGLGVLDAGSCHPRYLRGEAAQLDWPHAEVELFARFAVDGDGRRLRVLALLAAAPGAALAKEKGLYELDFVEAMSIDSARGVIGDFARMQTQCATGGKMARVLVGKGTAKSASQQAQRREAAKAVQAAGLPVVWEKKSKGDAPVEFSGVMTDKMIQQAHAVLAAAGITEEVWAPTAHTAGQLLHDLHENLVVWHPDEKNPWLLGYHTGFGDGRYEWHRLTVGDRIMGYVCNFMPEAEDVGDATATNEKEKPPAAPRPSAGSDCWSAEFAPKLAVGVNVAVRLGMIKNWFLAKVDAISGTTCKLVLGSKERIEAMSGDIVPMPDRQVFKVGDLIASHCVDSPLRPGIVRSVSTSHCEVEWWAGEPLSSAAIGELTFQDWLVFTAQGIGPATATPLTERKKAETPETGKASPALGPGIPVAVRGGKNKFVVGRIAVAVKDGFRIEYISGAREKVKEKYLVPVPNQPIFRVGDEVLARWSGNRLCPGTVTSLSAAGYAVTWKDGSAPQVVPVGSLTFQAWAL